MNTARLLEILLQLSIRPDSYRLTAGLPPEAFCLNQAGSQWEVYYSERGQKTGLVTFADEDTACTYLLGKLVANVLLAAPSRRPEDSSRCLVATV